MGPKNPVSARSKQVVLALAVLLVFRIGIRALETGGHLFGDAAVCRAFAESVAAAREHVAAELAAVQ